MVDSRARAPGRALPCELGRYTLFEHIGRGGMADLYVARATTELGATRLLVIKEVLPELSHNERFTEMLVAEAKLAAQLSHPNIVTVEHLGRDEGALYIAMEYVEGIDLRELLRRGTKRRIGLPIGFSLWIVCEVLKALEVAHRFKDDAGKPLRIVHRDVSPSNVLLSFEGEVKLCDFGIAVAATAPDVPDEAVEGKAGYMSPEHARGEAVDARSDVFSAGVMLWELLNGRRMYRTGPGERLIDVAARAQVRSVVARGLPDEARLHAIVARALEVNPSERFPTAGAMLAELEAYCADAQLRSSSIRFGKWLGKYFGDELVARRRAREAILRQLDTGAPQAISSEPPPSSERASREPPPSSERGSEPPPSSGHDSSWSSAPPASSSPPAVSSPGASGESGPISGERVSSSSATPDAPAADSSHPSSVPPAVGRPVQPSLPPTSGEPGPASSGDGRAAGGGVIRRVRRNSAAPASAETPVPPEVRRAEQGGLLMMARYALVVGAITFAMLYLLDLLTR